MNSFIKRANNEVHKSISPTIERQMHLDNEKIIFTGMNSNMASTAGLLISILTAGWCFTWNLYFFVPRRHILPSIVATGRRRYHRLSIVSAWKAVVHRLVILVMWTAVSNFFSVSV